MSTFSENVNVFTSGVNINFEMVKFEYAKTIKGVFTSKL